MKTQHIEILVMQQNQCEGESVRHEVPTTKIGKVPKK